MLKALSQSQIDAIAAQGRKLLQADREPPKYLNLANALALGQPLVLPFRGVEYPAKIISYREGIGLQIADLQRSHRANNPAQTVEEAEDDEVQIIQTLALFHSLLDPIPEVNPFADATPWEVAFLLGFFSLCLTTQNARQSAGSQFPTSTRSPN